MILFVHFHMIAYVLVMVIYRYGVRTRPSCFAFFLKIHQIHMNSPCCKIVPFHSVTFDVMSVTEVLRSPMCQSPT